MMVEQGWAFDAGSEIEPWREYCENKHYSPARPEQPRPDSHYRSAMPVQFEAGELSQPVRNTSWAAFTEHHPKAHFDNDIEVGLDWHLLATLDDEFVRHALRQGEQTGSLPDKELALLAFRQLHGPHQSRTGCVSRWRVRGDHGPCGYRRGPRRRLVGESWRIFVLGETRDGSFRVWGRCSPGVAEALKSTGQRLVRQANHMDVRGLGLRLRLVGKVTRSQADESYGYLGRIKRMEVVPEGASWRSKPMIMPVEAAKSLKPGDQVFRWWDRYAARSPMPLKVVSVNRKTLTVESRSGRRWRMPLEELGGTITSPAYV